MSLTYYLPEILFGCLAIVAILWGIMFIWSIFLSSKGKCSCRHCKGIASKTSEPPYLFLLPISFGTKYEDSEHYLASHIQPISDKSQSPSGRRACWVQVYCCPKCNQKQVEITDFLQVRGEETVESTYIFDYETFQPFIERWKRLYS